MTLNKFVLFIILTIFSSCSGQGISNADNGSIENQSTINAKGDTVAELPDSTVIVFQDKKYIYWFGSNGKGVYRYETKKKYIIRFTTKDGLCDDHVSKIEEDKSGNIFFTTNGGISKFDGQTFTTLTPFVNTGDEWKSEPDDLWFKAPQDSGVVYRYDGKHLHRLKFPKTKTGEEYIAEHPRSKYPYLKSSPYDVYSIYKDRKGNIWFGTASLGVCCYDARLPDGQGKKFTWITEYELGYSDIAYGVRSTIEDKEGNFWFSNTMNRYEVYTNESAEDGIKFRKIKAISNSNEYTADNFTYFMSSIIDSNGAMWLVTFSAGVWKYDLKNLTHYPVKSGDKTITLFSIFKDHQGVLWLGTHVDGAYKFNGKTFEKFKL